MQEEYSLLWNEIKVGLFIRSDETVTYVPEHDSASKLEEYIVYPDSLFEFDKTITPWKVKKDNPKGTSEIIEWLEGRIFPKERENAQYLINILGLKKYDMWEIMKKTEGKTFSDSYRVVFINKIC